MSGSSSHNQVVPGRSRFAATPSTGRTLCLCAVRSFPSYAGEILVLRVAGEVDLSTISVFEASLASSIGRKPAYLVVDLSRLRFCSAQGMGVLFGARAAAAERGFGYAISGVPSHLDGIWKRLWPDELPIRYRDEATAVGDIGALQARSG